MDSKSNQTNPSQSVEGATNMSTISDAGSAHHASAAYVSTEGTTNSGTSDGQFATAANNTNGEEEHEDVYDDAVEAELILQLQPIIQKLSQHYKKSKGRALKRNLDALMSLATERCLVLWEYDEPENSEDELSSLEFAEAKEFSVSLYIFAARLMSSYLNKSARVPRALIRNLGRIVNARDELLRSEREG